jgi:hypothetical protein
LWAFLCCSSLSTAFFSQYMCFVCWKILTRLWWYLLKQIERLDTIYARCNTSSWLLCDHSTYLIGSFSAVPGGEREKLWQEFLLDASQWCDHISEKVTEHQSCQDSYVNGAIALVGVNHVALCWLLSCHGLKFGRNSCQLLCTGGIDTDDIEWSTTQHSFATTVTATTQQKFCRTGHWTYWYRFLMWE